MPVSVLSSEQILDILSETGTLHTGHFLLTSGRHSDRYLQCVQVLQHPHFAGVLGAQIASLFPDIEIDLVVSPAMGGIIIGHETARALGVRALFAEREEGVMQLRRGQRFDPGSRILVVEDVLTTGRSVREVSEVVTALGGRVAAVGAIVDRSGGKLDFGVPTRAAIPMEISSYEPQECPLCREGLPLMKPGSRPA